MGAVTSRHVVRDYQGRHVAPDKAPDKVKGCVRVHSMDVFPAVFQRNIEKTILLLISTSYK